MPEAAARISWVFFFLFNYSFTILAVRNYFYSESMNGEMIGSRSSVQGIR